MTQDRSFGRRGIGRSKGHSSGRTAVASFDLAAPAPGFSYRELSGKAQDKDKPRGAFGTFFAGARGAMTALGGCTLVLSIFVILFLRKFAFVNMNVTMLVGGAAILLLIASRFAPAKR